MRTLTAQQEAALECNAGYSTFARVKVLRGATWHDLTELFEQRLDLLEEVTWNEAVDSPVASAQVRLRREVNGYSLAPLITTSAANLVSGAYSPLLLEGRTFTVEVAVVPLGMRPTTLDWCEAFRGRIDEVDSGEEGVSFSGRDYGGGLLQDTCIESEVERGSTLGTAVQTVMQDILNAAGLSAFTLYTPLSPSWNLGRYVQKSEPVADALAALARQLGWEWRYKWLSSGPGTGAWRLWFWSPDRAATVPVWSFGAGTYRTLGEVRTSIEDVRNVVEGVYWDRADLDAAGNPKRKVVLVSDATSITAHGRRFMRVAEGATSNINTASEMTTLVSRALADLKDRPLGVALEVGLHPGLELGDLVSLPGNEVHFTASQSAAVQSLTHTVNATTASTKVVLRGKPSTSRRVWLGMEQRPGIAPPSPFTGPNAPSNLSTETTVQGFRLRFDPPTVGPGAASYELHVSTTNGFTPSSSTRRNTSDATEFPVTDLTPGTTYYARVVPRDAKGNRGTASAQVTLTPRYVEPRLLQQRISWGSLPLNGDFEAANLSGAPPDAWRINSGTWGTNALATTDTYSGSAAVHFPNLAGSPAMIGTPFTVREGEVWIMSAFYKQSVGATLSGVLAFTYLDANLNAVGGVGPHPSVQLGVSASANTWTRAVTKAVIPVGARFGEISFTRWSGYGGTLTVDSVDALRLAAFETWQLPTFQNSWSDWNQAVFGQVAYRKNDLGEVQFMSLARAPTPAPAAYSTLFTLPAAYRPLSRRLFSVAVNGTTAAVLEVWTDGSVKLSASGADAFVSLDGIRFSVD
jgi:hypothetical protein